MTGNIVQFPLSTRDRPPQNLDEVIESIEDVKHIHIQEIIPLIINNIVSIASISGIPMDDPDDNGEDFAMMGESIRSFLMRRYDLEHPFHSLADNIFDESDEGYLTLKEELTFDIKGVEAT